MIKIYSFQFNDDDFLQLQYLTFKKFLKAEHELICINNSYDKPQEKKNIESRAKRLNIPHYFPQNVDHSRGAGGSHQSAIQWTWDNLIVKNNDVNIILDHDMFLIRPFLPDLSYDITGIAQGRGEHIKYFHPGFMIINNTLKDKETVSFKGEKIDGYDCDTGGNFWHYWKSHPELKVKGLNLVNIAKEHENLNVIPEQFRDGYNEADPMQICEDFMIHYRNGSNWAWTEKNLYNHKKEQLINTLNYYLNL